MAGFSQFQLQWWWAFALLLLTSICARAEVDPITIKVALAQLSIWFMLIKRRVPISSISQMGLNSSVRASFPGATAQLIGCIVRGITYQSFGMGSAGSTQVVDPLADGPTCSRDIPYFRKLNINVLRTYYLDPTRDHSACMNSLADAGIYVLTGLSSPTQSVLDYGWNTAMYAQYTGVVDSLATYSNVLAFSVAFGEATGLLSEYLPFYKAAIRDVKDYMKKKKYREIPIGWEAYFTDTETVTTDTPDFKDLQYMACDTSKADFLGIVPGFLGDDNCTSSKDIADDAKLYSNTSLPVFITQHGCAGTQCKLSPPPLRRTRAHGLVAGKDNRTYDYVPSLYNGSASQVLSGGIMIDYFKDNSDMPFGMRTTPSLFLHCSNHLGVVTVDGTFDINPLPGYTALSKVMATLKPSSTNAAEYTSTNSAPACPTSNAASPYNASVTLPAVPYAPLCDCLLDTLQCVTSGTTVDNYNSTQFIDGLQAVCEGDYDKNCPGVGVDPAKGKYGYFRYAKFLPHC